MSSSCSASLSTATAIPANTQLALSSPVLTSTSEKLKPSPSPNPTEEPSRLIPQNDMPFHLEWIADPSLSDEPAILIATGSAPGFGSSDDPPDFDYLSWDGERRPLLRIGYDEKKGNEFTIPPWLLLIPSSEPRYFAFTPSEEIEVKDIYWVDLLQKELFGYRSVCELITPGGDYSIAIGPKWITYVCDKDQTTWHLFSLDDPSVTTSLQLPLNNELSKGFRPSWLDADTLILNHRARPINRCVVDLTDPSEPVVSCQEFDPDLTLGRFSSDGTLMELRASYNTTNSHPQEIGVINTDCFASSIGCLPHLYPSPFGPDAGPRGVFLEDGAWLPDSSGILYVQLQSINSAWADKTYLWTFDLNQEIFTQIAYLDDPLVFYQDYNQSAPIWSPDETRVLLQNFSKVYAFDLTDNTLQLLNDDGGIAIGTVVLP